MAKLKLAILGGSGYGGAELLRTLLFHPGVEIAFVGAGEKAGRRVDEVYPNLRGFTDLVFEDGSNPDRLEGMECVFLALPHGQSQELTPRLPADATLIDLSGDFRLSDFNQFERYYGRRHTAPELQREFVYGLTEINRDAIRHAKRVANPGCFATAALIALCPVAARGLVGGRVVIDAKTGSSGSGATAGANTHHPTRASSFFAYKPFAHQHLPEILEALGHAAPDWKGKLIFQTHSAPMVRGIFASVYCELERPMEAGEVGDLYQAFYRDSPFVRLVESSPNVNWVKNSNFVDLGWAVDGRELILFAALDNLVKGAAGQAVQNMNLMHGFPETEGLLQPGSCP